MRCLLAMLILLLAPSALLAQISIDEKPRRYLVVRVDGAARDWEVRPIRITNKGGFTLPGASEGDFKTDVERWERTGLPKRYNTRLWRAAAAKLLRNGSDPVEGAKFYFYAINPRQPRAEGVVNLVDERKHIFWVPAGSVEVKGYPQTWVDVYEAFVTRQEGEARQTAVKQWEEAHRDIIKNVENSDEGFTQEERNEFARFYQSQFVWVRNSNPKLAGIYTELANFHHERNNLDAELSTYLDALRAGVESPDREVFALTVGRIFVNRLNLHGEAIPYLEMARNHSEALYLLARCRLESGEYEPARNELNALVTALQAADGSLVLETSAEQELGRAWLTLAELEFKQLNYAAANDAIGRIASGNPSYDAAQVLFCAMLLQRGEPRRDGDKSDQQKIRDVLKNLSFWQRAMQYANPGAGDFPLDPLMATAMVLYAQTDTQFFSPRPDKGDRKPSAEALRFLEAAKALDPLSAEPHYAEGRLYQRLGLFPEALAAFQAGLDVDPRHILLNFAMADLNLKAGVLSVAKDHLGRCLKYAPDFYPAHALLGEIGLGEVERVRSALLLRMAAGEAVDYAGEMVPPMKEAAAFFTSALAINGRQPAAKLALATLMLQLSEVAPLTVADRGDAEGVRKAYLSKARDLSGELMDELQRYSEVEHPRKLTEREQAQLPSLACYNVNAYALYAMGDHQGALAVFRRHIEHARDQRFIPDPTMRKEYEASAAFGYATEWVQRIEQNQRQFFEIDDFATDSTPNFYGNWIIPLRLKPDQGFVEGTMIRGGKLKLAVNQKDSGVISRFEVEKPHASLTTFEAELPRLGDAPLDFGIYMTKVNKSSAGKGTEADPKVSIFLGVDSQGRVFWETRKYDVKDGASTEKRLEYGLLDITEYGGRPLGPDDKLSLGLRRQYSRDMSDVDYIAIVNGWEIKLPVNGSEDDKLHSAELVRVDFHSSVTAVHCGFFTRALTGVKATIEVESVRFVYDSGLVRKK
ncbi:MAG: hypothetical protein H6841_09940 [Planctomycetes bacterium]|nr:hypothetical protein [Planctomycetota bacterium]MCB9935715.1 hypothetical protein [Planctomycetota bacterium]